MAISDLFLGDPRTRAARYAASRAEQGALRQTSSALQNRAANPAAAGLALSQARSDQRAANAGMLAQAQAADETARAQGAQQLIGAGLSTIGSILPFAMPAAGAAQQGMNVAQTAAQGGLGAALGQAPAGPAQGPGPTPQAPPAPFSGFGSRGATFTAPESVPGPGPLAPTAWGMQRGPADPTKPNDGVTRGVISPFSANPVLGPKMPGPGAAPQAPAAAPAGPAPGALPERPGPLPAPPGLPALPQPATLGGTMQESNPLFPGGRAAPLQETPPATGPTGGGLMGMLPVQPLTGGQSYRVEPQPLSEAEQILFDLPSALLGLQAPYLPYLRGGR